MAYKISKTIKGIRVNKNYIGDSFLEKETVLSDRKNIHQARPSRLREYKVVKVTSDLDINISLLKSLVPEIETSDIDQEAFNIKMAKVDAAYYNQDGNNHNWGNKAIALFLNDLFTVEIFEY